MQFYDNDAFLVDDVADFIFEGIWMEEGAIVVATTEHLAAIRNLLQQKGVHPQSGDHLYTAVNAEEALAGFMVQRVPDYARFKANMRKIIAKATPPGKRTRIYGEMVAVLWAQGNREAAIKLESLWNELADEYSFSLLCGYRMDSFEGQASEDDFRRVCELHSRIIPLDTNSPGHDSADRSRSIALLQQRSLSLEAEIGKRKDAESAVRSEKAKFQMAIDLTGLGVWEIDLATRKESWSTECKALFDAETLEGFDFQRLLTFVHVQDLEWFERSLRASLETDADFQVKFRVRMPSKEVRWLFALGRRIEVERARFVTLFVDITDKINAAWPEANIPDILENVSDDHFLALLKAIEELPSPAEDSYPKNPRMPEDRDRDHLN